MYMR